MGDNEVDLIDGPRKRAPYKISAKLSKAIRHITEGKKLTEAATLSSMSVRGLSLALRRPAVVARLGDHARAVLVSQLPKAATTVERVMDGDNNVAALNAARFTLGAAAGIAMPDHRGPLVNVNIGPAGYVLDLSEPAATLPGPRPPGLVIEGRTVGVVADE